MEGEKSKLINPEDFGGLGKKEERYFASQFSADIKVLRRLMNQKERLDWGKLGEYERGALTRLAAFSDKAEEEGRLDEKEVDFLQEIGAGKVPEKGSEERKKFEDYLDKTGLI